MKVGLRVDVDTLRGTRKGVPGLIGLLAPHGARASFFLSVGPDNMGRHLWRLLRPAFLRKMLRTHAASLYGWDVLLRGTVLPGPVIGRRGAAAIRSLAAVAGGSSGRDPDGSMGGHEIGLHAWDHHAWQSRVERMAPEELSRHLDRGVNLLTTLIGGRPTCSAAPAWRCTDAVLQAKLQYPFVYNSDCRGTSPFLPRLDDGSLGQLQLPATLPTYDEEVGRDGVTAQGYYDDMLRRLDDDGLKVLTIHAEVEGIVAAPLFDRFLARATEAGHRFVTLGELAAEATDPPVARLERRAVPGREGWAAWQAAA